MVKNQTTKSQTDEAVEATNEALPGHEPVEPRGARLLLAADRPRSRTGEARVLRAMAARFERYTDG